MRTGSAYREAACVIPTGRSDGCGPSWAGAASPSTSCSGQPSGSSEEPVEDGSLAAGAPSTISPFAYVGKGGILTLVRWSKKKTRPDGHEFARGSAAHEGRAALGVGDHRCALGVKRSCS